MEKRNLILLVIDSLSYKVLNSYPFPNELFINNYIKKSSYNYDNVYSQGPYTEASMNGLFYGQRGLDGGSFMFSHNKLDHSFVDIIHKDFYTINMSMCARLFVKHCVHSFDEYYYKFYAPTVFSTLQWNRINHFKELNKKRKLTVYETNCISELLTYAFQETTFYLKNYSFNERETSFSQNYLDRNVVVDNLKMIESTNNAFLEDKEVFISKLLNEEVQLPSDVPINVPYVDKDKVLTIFDKYKPILSKMIANHYSFSFKNLNRALQNIKLLITNTRKWLKILFDYKVKKKNLERDINYALSTCFLEGKRTISLSRVLEKIEEIIIGYDKEKPFFVYCQPNDFHPFPCFFSFDQIDDEIIEKELEDAIDLAKRIKNKNCNITNFLSINYIDKQIESFFKFLENNNLLDCTDIIITSDHGTWSYYDSLPAGDRKLIMTEERMHVPFLFYRKGIVETHDYNLHNTYSVPNTILSLMGYDGDSYFYGDSFGNDSDNEYLLCENLGFGCPDLYNNHIYYTVHNRRYKLLVMANINEEICLDKCVEFYDLAKDPLEEKNVLKWAIKTKSLVIREMLNIVEKRHKDIKSSNIEKDYYTSLKNKTP